MKSVKVNGSDVNSDDTVLRALPALKAGCSCHWDPAGKHGNVNSYADGKNHAKVMPLEDGLH